MKHVSLGVAFTGLALLIASCARSSGYDKSQEYYGEYPRSYYSQPGRAESPTKRIEVLGQPKKRVLVLDFRNDTPLNLSRIGAFTADELKRGLHLTERVIIPTGLPQELRTDDFTKGDEVRVAQLIREGRQKGVAVMVIGRIVRLIFRQRGDEVGVFRQRQTLAAADVEAKVFDVQAGREIMAIGRSGETSSNAIVTLKKEEMSDDAFRLEMAQFAVREAVARLVPDVLKAIEKMTWEGRIAKISGNLIYVNAGRNSGLVNGDILKVLTPGEDIYDPSTGAFLGRAEGQLKGTIEVNDFIGEDGSVTRIHTGGNFQEGDLVRLY